MIGIIFQFVNQIIEVRVDKNNILFRTGDFGGAFVPIDGLKLDKNGVIKEHPDLKDKDNWREESIKRFKGHIEKMETEIQKANYIISELKKVGYKPMYLQRAGFRMVKLK